MSVIVNEIKREVTRTEVVGKTYTITLSEQDAALVYYLVGAASFGEDVYRGLKPHFGQHPELSHTQQGRPGVDLSPRTQSFLRNLPRGTK